MKRALTLLLALMFVLALFAGCGGGTTGNNNNNNNNSSSNSGDNSTTDNGPTSNLPNGKFATDANGIATEPYDYTLPLTTSDEVFTFWSIVRSPEAVPQEGYNSAAKPAYEQELTGVNIEYDIVSVDAREQNYAVLLASDSLRDISAQARNFHPTTPEQAVEEGYWVNLYDYREYCPNYMYQVAHNRDTDETTYESVFYGEGMVPIFFLITAEPSLSSNYMARGDWLSDVGLTNDDIVTFDDLHDMLTAFKVNIDTCEFPWPIFNRLDMKGAMTFVAYDTLPYVDPYDISLPFVVDGTVHMSHVNEGDHEFMTMLNQWYEEGLIHPNWASFENNTSFTDLTTSDQVGYVYMSPGEMDGYEAQSVDPDAEWVPIHRPLRYEGQTIHLGGEMNRASFGNVSISAKCSNIPLVVSWCDWRYSPKGSEAMSWGPEGYLWQYDEQGNRVINPEYVNGTAQLAYAWACLFYGMDNLTEHGMLNDARNYIVPGSERQLAAVHYWLDWDYDGAYEYPAGAKLTQEQLDEVNSYSNDVVTYLAENYLAFLDSSKPLSEWDSYVSGLNKLGLDQITAVYQECYDDYLAARAAEAA